jgi:AraC-like DNA-binding protein
MSLPTPNSQPSPSYVWDDVTDRFLADYPVHCAKRTNLIQQRVMHAHRGFEFYLCTKGSGTLFCGNRMFPLHEGTLTVIPPHVVHRPYTDRNAAFHRYVLSVDVTYMEGLDAACMSPAGVGITQLLTGPDGDGGHFYLNHAQSERAMALLATLEEALAHDDPLKPWIQLSTLSELFVLIMGLHNAPQSTERDKSAEDSLLGDVLEYLIANYRENIQIEDVTKRFPVSRSYLLRLFKEKTGDTIMRFVAEYRLNEARRLLAAGTLSVTEIASRVGFGDLSHFFGLFKKATGLTPKQYRDRVRGG